MPTLSITVTNAQATRIATAYGDFLDLSDENNARRPATLDEVQAHIVAELKRITLSRERQAAEKAITDASF